MAFSHLTLLNFFLHSIGPFLSAPIDVGLTRRERECFMLVVSIWNGSVREQRIPSLLGGCSRRVLRTARRGFMCMSLRSVSTGAENPVSKLWLRRRGEGRVHKDTGTFIGQRYKMPKEDEARSMDTRYEFLMVQLEFQPHGLAVHLSLSQQLPPGLWGPVCDVS